MTPALIELYRPKGLPTAKASSPTRIAPGFPKMAGTNISGSCSVCTTAMSFSGCSTTICALRLGAVGVSDLNAVGSRDDVQTCEDSAAVVDDDPAPQAVLRLTVLALRFRLNEDQRRSDHLIDLRRISRRRRGGGHRLRDGVADFARGQRLRRRGERVVQQQGHESRQHARSKGGCSSQLRAETPQTKPP